LTTLRHPFQHESVVALNDVSLDVFQGECFGLLGQNGAGKTTLFKILATLILSDEGKAWVEGRNLQTEAASVRQYLTPVIANERSLNWRLSAWENLRLFAALHGLSHADCERRVAEVLEVVALTDTGAQLVGEFSSGMKQRLLIARALLPRPRVLLLDEPTRSLDPVSAQSFRRFLRQVIVGLEGCTVMLATHNTEEVQDLCDRVAVLHRGEVLAVGSTERLIARYGEPKYRLWTDTPDHPALAGAAGGRPPQLVSTPSQDGWTCVEIVVPGGVDQVAQVLSDLMKAGVTAARFERVELSLADLLQRVVAHEDGHRE